MSFNIGDIVVGVRMSSSWDGVRIKVTHSSVDLTTGTIVFMANKDATYLHCLGRSVCFYTNKCELVGAAETVKIRKNLKIFAKKGWGP